MLQDNLSFFLEACQQLGLKESQLFSLEDLQPSATSPYRSKRCAAVHFVLVEIQNSIHCTFYSDLTLCYIGYYCYYSFGC